ncbi:MAG: tRNA lysidine(34) synthetase TilS [Flavobacteriaceae bacterium]|nr:tRNA lysidine(34) synthetase TilS [Flavobacteriaceae bacterium]
MLKAFKNYIKKEAPFLKKNKILIALSGGLDSVVLTHLCVESGLDVALAHCNFNLRAEESDADENFVLRLAEALDLELFVEYFDTETYAENKKISIQMAARELRYQWFFELAEQLDFDHILTAHHADDNLETFLINLSRGCGLDGLTGIPNQNEKILRPLLTFSRNDLEGYASEKKLEWREDSSNASVKYLRNKIRHEIIPKLKETNPQFLENFNRTIGHLKEAQGIIDDRLDDVSDNIIDVKDDSISFSIEQLNALNDPKAYLYELIKDYGFTQWDDVYALFDAQSGKQLFSQNWRLLKDRDRLILTAIEDKSHDHIHIEALKKEVPIPIGKLVFETVESLSDTDHNVIFVDRDRFIQPLYVKKWEEGDSFHPFGLNGRKKVSKYFKDEKMSLIDKENSWLLCSGQDIVWIIGRRADERFKVTDKTKQILKIELK